MIQLIKQKYPAIGQTFSRAAYLAGTPAYNPRRMAFADNQFEFDTFNTSNVTRPPLINSAPLVPEIFTPISPTVIYDDFPTGRPVPGAPPPSIPVTPVPTISQFPTFDDPTNGFTPTFVPDVFNPIDVPNYRGPRGAFTPPVNIPNRFARTQGISTFSRFNMSEDVLQQQTEIVTGGVWSSGNAALTTFWSSSAQTVSQRRYYVEVYDGNPATDGSAAQFSIAYGHAFGSGSSAQGQLNDSPSRAIYSQYRNLLLPAGTSKFVTQGSGSTNSIYALSFNRNRLKERLDPGNFEIPVQTISSRDTNASGSVSLSGVIHTLIDDSSINTGSFTATGGRVYNLVSGSISTGVFNPSAPVYYGLSYPDYGVVIFDGNVLDEKLAFTTGQTTNVEANNHFALFRSISGSSASTSGFLARNSEKITSTHYFVRIKNGQFNYSNNPTFISGSNGDVLTGFLTDPITYITTVGLYNDQQELLAIAKVSQPILKSFSRESLIRVKLDF